MNYVAVKNRVNDLISKYSDLTITLSRTDTTGYERRYDPVTDTYKWYKNGVLSTAPTATVYTGACLEASANEYFKARGYIKETDKIFLTVGIPKPISNEVVTVAGVSYTVYRVVAVNPGGTEVLYRIYVRV
jgi:hypothetical protein